jgi:hypothetical protein
MSNIHRISDLENNNNNNNRRDRVPMLGSNLSEYPEARKEPFSIFLKNFFCPLFSFKSFIFCISLVDLTLFIISIIPGIEVSDNYLIPPKQETLDKMGSIVNYPNIDTK